MTVDSVTLKQQFGVLMGKRDDSYHIAVMYIVYKTIEVNSQITINRLKALLTTEYLIEESVIDGAIASLMSRSMFDCVSRWRNPGKPVGETQLSITKPPPEEFCKWMTRTTDQYPELSVFIPPVFQYKKKAGGSE